MSDVIDLNPSFVPSPAVVELLTKDEIIAALRISASAFYALIAKGEFPKPIKFGTRSLWLKTDLDAFLLAKAAARNVGPTRRRLGRK